MKQILKINYEFANLISENEKVFEYRKIDKNYINVGDRIYFLDMNEQKVLVKKVVVGKKIMSVGHVLNKYAERGSKEYNFIFDNYHNEDYIIQFELGVYY